jgi:manganese/zinc/iron transport system ATP- binding protein
MKHPALTVKNICVSYQEKSVLESVSFEIPVGTISAIVGPNGAGKSTLLKAILGLLPPASGTITFFGKHTDIATHVAYIPQKNMVDFDFPATVYDVVLMGRYPHLFWYQSLQKDDHQKAAAAIDFVGLTAYKCTAISNLSGGQQQLCFIARALCQNADLLILDEPFVGVDAPGEKKIITLLKQLAKEGKTVIIVHHDLATLSAYFDWIIFLNKTVIAYGKATDLLFDEIHTRHTYFRANQYDL